MKSKRKHDALSKIVPFDVQDKLQRNHSLSMYLSSEHWELVIVTIWWPLREEFVEYELPLRYVHHLVEAASRPLYDNTHGVQLCKRYGKIMDIDPFSGVERPGSLSIAC